MRKIKMLLIALIVGLSANAQTKEKVDTTVTPWVTSDSLFTYSGSLKIKDVIWDGPRYWITTYLDTLFVDEIGTLKVIKVAGKTYRLHPKEGLILIPTPPKKK